jgi:hypothetical protein
MSAAGDGAAGVRACRNDSVVALPAGIALAYED